MKLKHYFLVLVVGIATLAGIGIYALLEERSWLFYATECLAAGLFLYLSFFFRKVIRPYETLIGGMELVRDLDLTTRLALSGQHETDVIVRTFNDLLARLRSEHLSLEEQYNFLTLLIKASPLGVVQCNLDGDVTSMNPAARKMMSPAIEQTMQSLPLDTDTTVRPPGEPQLFRISHLSFPDRGYRHPFFLIESLTDEVRKAEKAAYERIIRMIAHEVNNSVAGIVGSLADDERERLLALSKFVTRIAEVVKIPQPQLQLCDLSEEVEACRPFLESLCTVKGIRIGFRLTDEATPVRLDTVLFQQVLINIVKNSIEAGAKEITITLADSKTLADSPLKEENTGEGSAKEASPIRGGLEGSLGGSGDREESSVELSVIDNGPGIPPEVSANLFTPFFSTKPQGQGIGLMLIRDILSAHGCSFSLLTDPADHLTRFTIHFPSCRHVLSK